ncbi:MAG: transposase [Stigonema ocellatum SAG 48.90 = DSM 106950]|nr:transposase [Stigonema ocellatum SAG 48.90 = DSM 106950]
MKYNPHKHHRQSIRLKGYDYCSAGGYFITICTHQRECLFGEVVDGAMQLNEFGQIVAEEWERSPNLRREIKLDVWIVMPNHFHGIVFIQPVEPQPGVGAHDDGVGAQGLAPLQYRFPQYAPVPTKMPSRKPRSLGSLIAGFKMAVTKRINLLRDTPTVPIWQRNYYEHIIRHLRKLIMRCPKALVGAQCPAPLHHFHDYVYSNSI